MRLYVARRRANPIVSACSSNVLRGHLGVLARVAAGHAVVHAALADEASPAGGAARCAPPTGRRRGCRRSRRTRRVVGAQRPADAEVPVEQAAHRRADPRRHVHAVGDVADRDVVDVAVGPHAVPHPARDDAVALGDAVGRAAGAQRELGDAERLALVVGVRAPQAQERVGVGAGLGEQAVERRADLVGRVRVVARRHRRVRREHRALARVGQRVVEARAAGHRAARGLERGERRVALVHVHDAGLDAERAQGDDPAGAEQRVLLQARAGIAVVQARGDPARDAVVLRHLGVEEEERDAPDVHPPDLRHDVAAADRHGDLQRRALGALGDEHGGRALGVGRDPELLLPAGDVDALAEVAAAVHEADGDERQRHVGRLLDDVAGQRAQAAGVDRQRLVHRVLGAEERDRALLVDDVGPRGPGEVLRRSRARPPRRRR